MKLAVAVLSNQSESDFQVFCDHSYLGGSRISGVMSLTGANFKIGEAF